MHEARSRRQKETRENLLKALFVVFGVPLATCFGICNYWWGAYLGGEVPFYAAASTTMLRGMFVFPLQILTTALLVFLGRRLLRHAGWIMMLLACVLAGIGAPMLERWARSRGDAAGVRGQSWPWFEFCGPHLVGMAALAMLACAGLVARRKVRAADAPA